MKIHILSFLLIVFISFQINAQDSLELNSLLDELESKEIKDIPLLPGNFLITQKVTANHYKLGLKSLFFSSISYTNIIYTRKFR